MSTARDHLIRLLEASAGQEPKTPAERLRARLSELEIRVANIADTGEEVLAIPRLLDEVVALMAELEAAGVDVKPEQTRLTTVQGILRRKAAQFVREANKGEGLRAAREHVHPPPDHWWWYLDDLVARQRRQRARRVVGIALGVALLIVGLGWFIQSRLPDDPRLRRIIDLEQMVDAALADGEWGTARTALEELRQLDPENAHYAVLLGAVYQRLGETARATAQFEDARARLGDGPFYRERAQAYLRVGLVQEALADAQQAVDLLPDDPEAQYYLGNAYEAMGDVPAALAAYQRASELAEAQDNAQLLALIRVRMAFLLQAPRLPTPTPQPTKEGS